MVYLHHVITIRKQNGVLRQVPVFKLLPLPMLEIAWCEGELWEPVVSEVVKRRRSLRAILPGLSPKKRSSGKIATLVPINTVPNTCLPKPDFRFQLRDILKQQDYLKEMRYGNTRYQD